MNYAYLTGIYADGLFESVGIRVTKIRYNGTLIKPTPMVARLGPQPQSEVGFQLTDSENLQTYTATIPVASLQQSIPGSLPAALYPDAVWQVSVDGGTTWEDVRVLGEPDFSPPSQRYKITFVGEGIGQ